VDRWRPLFRTRKPISVAQRTAVSLYAFGREAAPLTEWMLGGISTLADRRGCVARLRSAGIVLCACAALIAVLVWPASRWSGS
jgi:hypothetical protein